jgi:uncharacterized protein YegP (UPF0339 family)
MSGGLKMWKYELFQDEAGKWRWRLFGPERQTVMTSGESFRSRGSARRALVRARNYAGQATLPLADGLDDMFGEVLERIAKRDDEEQLRRASIAALN